jgi:hypothetical protein
MGITETWLFESFGAAYRQSFSDCRLSCCAGDLICTYMLDKLSNTYVDILTWFSIEDGSQKPGATRSRNANLFDVEPFNDRLASGDVRAEADCNEDGIVNLLDVDFFMGGRPWKRFVVSHGRAVCFGTIIAF